MKNSPMCDEMTSFVSHTDLWVHKTINLKKDFLETSIISDLFTSQESGTEVVLVKCFGRVPTSLLASATGPARDINVCLWVKLKSEEILTSVLSEW